MVVILPATIPPAPKPAAGKTTPVTIAGAPTSAAPVAMVLKVFGFCLARSKAYMTCQY